MEKPQIINLNNLDEYHDLLTADVHAKYNAGQFIRKYSVIN